MNMKSSIGRKILLYLSDWIIYRVLLFSLVITGESHRWKIKGLRIFSHDDPTKYEGINAYLSLVNKDEFFLRHVAKYINAVVIFPKQYSIKYGTVSRIYVIVDETSANAYSRIITLMLLVYKNKVGDAVYIETLNKLSELYDKEMNSLIEDFHRDINKRNFPDYLDAHPPEK